MMHRAHTRRVGGHGLSPRLNMDPTYKIDPITDRDSGGDLWPRRLLHVPTMVSMERQDEHTYGGIEKPAYNILSYTWGRYEDPNQPAIEIGNITWPVPSIDPARFTVAEFQNVINTASKGVQFIWVDIACIDQLNVEVKMEEIGRQAGIFNNAKDAFVWLHGTPIDILQTACNQLFELTGRLDGEETTGLRLMGDPGEDLVIHWEPEDSGPDINVGTKNFIPFCMSDAKWLEDTMATLKVLISDTWFTSLWTLQEAFMRPEATLLSREGSIAFRKGYAEIALLSLLLCMGELDRVISKVLHHKTPVTARFPQTAMHSLMDLDSLLQQIGLGAWENPNLLYHSTKFRQTRDPLDRVYGIMQVYGFRLGASEEPKRSFTLDELEEQFAERINEISPISGQLFVHTQAVALGKCWQINQDSHLPHPLRFATDVPASICSIKVDKIKKAHFEGFVCPFPHLAELWTEAAGENEGYLFWGVDGAMQVVALDATEFVASNVPKKMIHCENEQFERNQALTSKLVGLFGTQLEVLMLGHLVQPDEMDEEDDEIVEDEDEMVEDEDEHEMNEDEDKSPDVIGSLGLLTRRVKWEGSTCWQRLGICVWAMKKERNTGVWEYQTGRLA